MSSGLLTVEPVNAYRSPNVKYPKTKYSSVINPNDIVSDDVSSAISNSSGSRNDFALIAAVNIIAANWHVPISPTPSVFPIIIFVGLVDVTSVSIIFDVFSVVIELDT